MQIDSLVCQMKPQPRRLAPRVGTGTTDRFGQEFGTRRGRHPCVPLGGAPSRSGSPQVLRRRRLPCLGTQTSRDAGSEATHEGAPSVVRRDSNPALRSDAGQFRDVLGMESAFSNPDWAGFTLPSGPRDLVEVFGPRMTDERVAPAEFESGVLIASPSKTSSVPGRSLPPPTSSSSVTSCGRAT